VPYDVGVGSPIAVQFSTNLKNIKQAVIPWAHEKNI
jgi:hypothetical protein